MYQSIGWTLVCRSNFPRSLDPIAPHASSRRSIAFQLVPASTITLVRLFIITLTLLLRAPMSRAQYQPLNSLATDPIRHLVPPGRCQLRPDEWTLCPLLAKIPVSPSVYLLRFQLPDRSQPLNLSTCSCILARTRLPTGQVIIRPYTPISTNQLVGCFDLLVKDYGPNALMSHILCQQQPVPEVIGTPAATDDDDSSIGRITFSHSNANVKIQAPFPQKHIVLLAGGTGIAPMLQALHAMLGTDPTDDGDEAGTNDTPRRTVSSGLGRPNKITLLYGSKTQHDILAQQLLDRWSKQFDQIFTVEYILSDEPLGSSWNGRRGYINQALLEEHGILPRSSATPATDDDSAKSSTVLVMVCGPPPFYDALCGPRDERAVIHGALGTLGFSADQVYKF